VGSWSVAVRLVVLGVFGGGVAVGCGGQTTEQSDGATLCPDLCKKGKPCPAAPLVGDCDDFCLAEDYRATQTGCHDQYDAAELCISKAADICMSPTTCAAEINATNTCEIAYCNKHMQDEVCVVPMQ
jgi:hypothetical protein